MKTEDETEFEFDVVTAIPLGDVHVSELNPRQPSAEDPEIGTLADSLERSGQIDACVGRPHPTMRGQVELCAGARRRVALEKNGAETIDVVVRDLDDRKFAELLLVEQIEREEFTPMEEARAVQNIVSQYDAEEEGGRTKMLEKVGAALGRKLNWVYSRLSLLDLSAPAQVAIDESSLPLKVASELCDLTEVEQAEVVESYAGKGLAGSVLRDRIRKDYKQAQVVDEFLDRGEKEGEPAVPGDWSQLISADGVLHPGGEWLDLVERPSTGHLKTDFRKKRVPTYGEILGSVDAGVIHRIGDRNTGRTYRVAQRSLVWEADGLSKRPILRAKPVNPTVAKKQVQRRDAETDEARWCGLARETWLGLIDDEAPNPGVEPFLRGLVLVAASECPGDRLDFFSDSFQVRADDAGSLEKLVAGELIGLLAVLFFLRKAPAPQVTLETMANMLRASVGLELDVLSGSA